MPSLIFTEKKSNRLLSATSFVSALRGIDISSLPSEKGSTLKGKKLLLTGNIFVSVNLFGSIVYDRATVYKRQNFLKVVVHVIIIDQ